MSYLTRNKITKRFLQDVLALQQPSSGSLILFTGKVRKDRVGNAYVREIVYEAYEEMAEKQIREIEREAMERFKVEKVIIRHRIGRVKLGEIAFLVAVLSAHRKEGFQAIQYIVDEVKNRVPIWKKEVLSDGKTRWKEETEDV